MVSIELGEQTTKSNGVSELFMGPISHFLSFLPNSSIVVEKANLVFLVGLAYWLTKHYTTHHLYDLPLESRPI